MKNKMPITTPLFLIAFLSSCLTSINCAAEDIYITDKLFVPLRSGMGNQYRIVHKGLPSGYKLEFLAESEDEEGNTWVQVKTQKNIEGWIRQQYVFSEPTAAIKLAKINAQLNKMDGNKKQLIDELDALKEENSTLQKQQILLQQTLKQTNKEYVDLRKLSTTAIQLDEQHKKLNENHQILQTRAEGLEAKNEMLEKSQDHKKWLFGAFILVAGVILSFVLQSVGRSKRDSGWR